MRDTIRRSKRIAFVLIGVTFAAVVVIILGETLRVSRQASHVMTNASCLERMLNGIHNYHGTYGQIPHVAIFNDEGVRVHSWRTTIVPWLTNLPRVYRWDEPWDGPFNIRLAKGLDVHVEGIPTYELGVNSIGPYDGPIDFAFMFRCEPSEDVSSSYCHFFAVVGNQTAWPIGKSRSFSEFSDGLENTILIVQSHELTSYWSQPEDLYFDGMSLQINDVDKAGISSATDIWPLVGFADGSVFHVNPQIPPSVLRALLTANGGEAIERSDLIREGWLSI
ncbi:hypothetical protein CA13_00830 [Planctomycetes bacterium CA13]|uniref:DUF1559 domain-containing protein n=1 Tax=Novipirellula herctigrandis TaxID=2527986 RepID=A0A5C5YVY6_9BACT|nr:hypothetical protein CA13_00830 [Planctomycetes bacterium CA13]